MMKLNSALRFIPIVLLVAAVSGCSSEERTLDERLFGSWTAYDRGRSFQMVFNRDGTFATDMVSAVRASKGEYWVVGGDTLVIEGSDDANQVAHVEGLLYIKPALVVPRAMQPIGTHNGVFGYWSTSDGALTYEFRGEGQVIRRELLGDNRSQSLISKGAWVETSPTTFETTFSDTALSGTLELLDGQVLGQVFRR